MLYKRPLTRYDALNYQLLMKYFIGITPPEDTCKKITSFQKSFAHNILPTIFEPHITVKSRNGLTEDLVWLDIAKTVIKNHSSFEISFDKIDSFSDSVIIIRTTVSKELIALHKALYHAIKPTETDPTKKYFENDNFEAHLTLGMSSWGMTLDELAGMKAKATHELMHLPSFPVTLLRIYCQEQPDEPFKKILDIPLNEI